MSAATAERGAFSVVAPPAQRDLYRILLLRKNGSELLVAGERPPFTLPCVEIPRWERVAENVIAAVRKRYGISVICLFTPELSATTTDGDQPLYQVMETREADCAAPDDTCWLPADSSSDQSFADGQDFVAITDMLRQIAGFQSGEAVGRFGRPGWIEELFSWVQHEIDPYELRLSGEFRQLNASPTFALLRLETNGQAVWFKAVGEPNLREFPISVTLSRLFPGFVPAVVATHLAWHGWLTTEFAASTLDEVPDACAWERAAQTLAELQIASVGMTDQLLEAGCRDLRVTSLLPLVDPFMEVMSQLMERQPRTPPPILGGEELRRLGKHIKDALSDLAELNIPDTLGHLDFNPGNILCSADQCIFLDWAEAYVGPPFLTLKYLREHLLRLRREDTSLGTDVVKAYETKWHKILSPETVSAAQDLAPVLAVFAYAAGTAAWQNPKMLRESKIAAYLRSLTRRMHIEIQRLQDRRQPCCQVTANPPYSPVEPVTEVLHGVPITDPYRWLEDQESPRTREWLAAQTQYARAYLDAIPGRERIRERIRELLDVETYDSIQRVGKRYAFRKRVRGQEQPCIFLREGFDGEDQLLIDPQERRTGNHTALRPLRLSQDGCLLLYEVKEGGERTGTFELIDVDKREKLPDALPRGYLRGFSFAPDARSFYYVHEALGAKRPHYRAAYHHVLGTAFDHDREIFCAGENEKLRLQIVPGEKWLGILVFRSCDKTYTDFYLWSFDNESPAELLVENADYKFGPLLLKDRILAITDRGSPKSRIVEVRPRAGGPPEFVDVIAESDCPIRGWAVTSDRIYVSYIRGVKSEIEVFGLQGRRLGQLPVGQNDTVQIVGASAENDELLIEQESFTKPIQIWRCSAQIREPQLWARRAIPFDSQEYVHVQVWFSAKDGTRIPMFLVGRHEVLTSGPCPTIMTSYGGYGVPMTPQFSVFVSFLMERGCLFVLPNIRGGSEFGVEWHNAAKRRNRQVAIDDFLAAAEWLIETGRTRPPKLAIFGGSNSGLLVGAALTQRPDLFRAVVCMVPMLDMLRYHLFDNAHVWVDEFGTADDPDDFPALARYSPYHQVRNDVAYPATMIVSGDADQNCNSLHARKMTARLQAANVSDNPIVLNYGKFRGHSPVLPLSERVEALTDRMAFLCDQLGL